MIVFLAALVFAAQPPQPDQNQKPSSPSGDRQITITGCVESGPNNTFMLVAAPEAAKEAPTGTTATTPAGSKVMKTVTYTLVAAKSDELKPHVGHTIQVTGVESAPQATAQTTDRSAAPAATSGTAGANPSPRATVETTAQTQIVARNLTVSSVKMVSASCTLVK
jgi:hypothetical protein